MGARVGTIFVELDLDTSGFTRSEQRILNDSKRTAANIEKDFRSLGSKSSAVFDAMRAQATNAYHRIANNAKATSEDIVRAERLKVERLRQINGQYYQYQDNTFKDLGIRSAAAIKEQKKQITESYEHIKRSGTASSQDLVNIERAKTRKLKDLDNELLGHKQQNLASLTRSVLRFYAAYYVISSAAQQIGRLFMGGVEAIDQMKISAIATAAQITSMQGTTGDITENYRKNLEYAKALVPVMMQIDAASFANLEQLQKMNQAMIGQGVLLNVNNQKQIEAFTAISNSIAMLTAGANNPSQQAFTEMRALMSGQLRQGADVARNIDAVIKRQGIYKDGLKEIVALGQKHGNTLELLEPYLRGVTAAAGDVQKTWASALATLKTTWTILQMDIFADFYGELTTGIRKFAIYLRENKDQIKEYIDKTLVALEKGVYAASAAFLYGMAAVKGFFGSFKLGLGALALFSITDILDESREGFEENKRLVDGVKGEVESLTDYLKTDALPALAEITGTALRGWNSLPDVIKDFGLVGAVFGGAKIRAAILLVSTAIGQIEKLNELGRNSQGDQGSADRWRAEIYHAEIELERQRVLYEMYGNSLGHGDQIKELTDRIADLKDKLEETKRVSDTVFDGFLNDIRIGDLKSLFGGPDAKPRFAAEKGFKFGIEVPVIPGMPDDDGELEKRISKTAEYIKKLEEQIKISKEVAKYDGDRAREQEILNAIQSQGLYVTESLTEAQKKQAAEIRKLVGAQYDLSKEQRDAQEGIAAFEKSIVDAASDREAAWAQYFQNVEQGSARHLNYMVNLWEQEYEKMIPLIGGDAAQKLLMSRFAEFNDQYGKDTEETAEEVSDIWENTRNTIQNSMSGLFGDALKGELDTAEDYFRSFADSIIDIWSTTLSQMIMKSFGPGGGGLQGLLDNFITLDPTTSEKSISGAGWLGIGATALSGANAFVQGRNEQGFGTLGGMALGAFGGPAAMMLGGMAGGMLGGLFGGSEPSETDRLLDSIGDLINELKNTTDAFKQSTKEMLYGKDFSEAGIMQNMLSPKLFRESILNNRTIMENFAIPEVTGYGGSLLQIGKPAADRMTSLFDDLGLAELQSLMRDVFAGEGSEFFGKLMDLDPLADKLADGLYGSIEAAFLSGKSQQRNKATAEAVLGVIDEILANVENQATSEMVSMEGAIKSWAGNIPEFDKMLDPGATALTKTKDEMNEAFNAFKKNADEWLELNDTMGGALLDSDLITRINGVLDKLPMLGEAIDEHFANKIDDLVAEIDAAVFPMSALEQAYQGVYDDADRLRLALIDNGMAAADAAEQAKRYTEAKLAEVEANMLGAPLRELEIRNLELQAAATGDASLAEQALQMRRDDHIESLRKLYGAEADAESGVIEWTRANWKLEDSVNAVTEAVVRAAEDLMSIAKRQAQIMGRGDLYNTQLSMQSLGITSASGIGSAVEAFGQMSTKEIVDAAYDLGMSADIYQDHMANITSAWDEHTKAAEKVSSSSRSAADSMKNLADVLKNKIASMESIDDLLLNIKGGGDLAPVQSMEFFERRYAQLIGKAEASLDERDVKAATDFAKQYLDFAKAYGGGFNEQAYLAANQDVAAAIGTAFDSGWEHYLQYGSKEGRSGEGGYAGLTDAMAKDFEELQNAIAPGKTLDDLYKELESIDNNTRATATNIGNAIGKTIVQMIQEGSESSVKSLFEEYGLDESAIRNAAVTALQGGMGKIGPGYEIDKDYLKVDIYQHGDKYRADFFTGSGQAAGGFSFTDDPSEMTLTQLENLLSQNISWRNDILNKGLYYEDEVPQYASGGHHSGGLRLVGEQGPELEFTGPSRIASNKDTVDMIAQAVGKALSGNPGGGGDVTVKVYIGDRELKDYHVTWHRTDPEAQAAVRRAA